MSEISLDKCDFRQTMAVGRVRRQVARVTPISRGSKKKSEGQPVPTAQCTPPLFELELRQRTKDEEAKSLETPTRIQRRRRTSLARRLVVDDGRTPLDHDHILSKRPSHQRDEMALLNREDLLSPIMVAPSMAE